MTNSTGKKRSLGISDIYLIFYNIILAIGWLIILMITQQTILSWKSNNDLFSSKNVYLNVEFFLQIFQTAALLEVVHASIGLVRSNPVLTLLQVLSRIIVVWLIMFCFESPKNSVGTVICCVVWPIAEITRYMYYALNILDKNNSFLTWCRYSFFIVLYPIGITGELICIYKAVEFLKPLANRRKFSYNLPNSLNWSFDLYYFLILVMISYIPVFPQLYGHMLVQRKKMLGGADKNKSKKQN